MIWKTVRGVFFALSPSLSGNDVLYSLSPEVASKLEIVDQTSVGVSGA